MNLVVSLKNLFPGKPDNEWLMEQYRLTQKSQFLEQLYDSCADDLYHFLLSQTDQSLAQDICQRTWLKVIEKRNSYRCTGRFNGWLFAIARNLLIDELRRLKKFVPETEVASESLRNNQSHITSTDLQKALHALPFFQREAIVLQQDGFGLQEIAHITGEEVETIKSRIRYGKAKLKKIWSTEIETI